MNIHPHSHSGDISISIQGLHPADYQGAVVQNHLSTTTVVNLCSGMRVMIILALRPLCTTAPSCLLTERESRSVQMGCILVR